MAGPVNVSDVPPIFTFTIAAITFVVAVVLILWRFFDQLKKKEPTESSHVILERAEIADMTAVRDLVRDMKTGLERLGRVEELSVETQRYMRDLLTRLDRTERAAVDMLAKFDRMERDAVVANEVRREMAQRLLEERGGFYRRGDLPRRTDDDG